MDERDLETKDRLGRTALLWAAWLHGPDETRRLLDLGACIETTDSYGWTPLTVAVRAEQTETVRLLLARGASIPATDVYGQTVLTMALGRKLTAIAQMLEAHRAKEPALIVQARQNGIDAIPTVDLEKRKSRFEPGERVFFWIGVSPLTDAPIPKTLWNTTWLHITEPNGTLRTERGIWPMDGCMERGWMGGCGLRRPDPEPGVYKVVFEFAGLKTEPVKITVGSSADK